MYGVKRILRLHAVWLTINGLHITPPEWWVIRAMQNYVAGAPAFFTNGMGVPLTLERRRVGNPTPRTVSRLGFGDKEIKPTPNLGVIH